MGWSVVVVEGKELVVTASVVDVDVASAVVVVVLGPQRTSCCSWTLSCSC